MPEMTETFWVGLYTFGGGFILAIFAVAYKSKCDKVNICWGGIEIHRAVEIELQEDMKQVRDTPFEDAKEEV